MIGHDRAKLLVKMTETGARVEVEEQVDGQDL